MSRFSLMIVSLVLFVIGLFVIFSSINWGSEAASAYLRSQGGGMDSTKFMIILQEYINMYRWMGGILSIVSGAGLIKALEPR
jgi:hypothetical protein